MTKKELAEMHPLEFAKLILQERLDRMYKQDTPTAEKMKESIDAVTKAKENEDYLLFQMGRKEAG